MPKINPEIFRGYDVRGVVGKDLTPTTVELLAKGYASYLAKRRIHHAIIGYDCRLSSPKFHKIFIKNLRNSGVNVLDIGLSLVQMMYWAQYRFGCNGGVFISASHNPKEYNGMKLAVGYSNTLVTEEIQALRKMIEKNNFIKNDKHGSYRKVNIENEYFDDLLKRIDIQKKFKVVVDPSYSTPGKFVPKLLEKAGCKVIRQNCELNGNFPIGTPDPTEKIISERIAKRVLQEKADIGFSFDSDGDRIGVVDEQGNIIWNDMLVALFAQDVLKQLPKAKIIYNTLCSKAVEEAIKKANGIPIIWLTGHSFIKEKVALERAPFGGELSGHFFFADNFFGHDDGCFAMLRILNILSATNTKLSALVKALPQYISSPEIKVGCPDSIKFDVVIKIGQTMKKDYPSGKLIDIDGSRLDFPDSMMIVRASQNGPYLTVKFEAKTQAKYDELKKYLYQILKKIKSIDWKFGVNVESLTT